MDRPSPHKSLAALFWSIVLIAPMPGIVVYLAWISDLEQYGYIFPLYLALAALIFFRWDFRLRLPGDRESVVLVSAAMLMTFVSAVRASPWLSSIAFALALLSWLRTHRSNEGMNQRLTYLGLLLLMTIRLPLNLDLRLTAALQRATSRVSSYLLDSFEVTHYLRGNVIELPGGTLFVEEACSGVQSLFTVLFLVCLWMVFRRRPVMAAPVYLLAGMIWAMVMNVVRITSVALAQEWYATDLSSGVPHEILGWICLVVAIVMMLSTDRFLRVALFPVPPDESGHLGNPVSRLWNWALLESETSMEAPSDEAPPSSDVAPQAALPVFAARALVGVALLIGIPSLAFGYRVIATRFQTVLAQRDKPLLWDPGSNLMKKTNYAPLVTNHESLRNANSKQLGNHADVWTVVVDGLAVRIAVSQPYPEWHDMRLCYSGSGWQVNDWNPILPKLNEEIRSDPQADAASPEDIEVQDANSSVSSQTSDATEEWEVSYAEMVSDTGDFGTLLFCGMTQDRELLSPPMSGLYNLLDDRIKDRASMSSNIIMLQLWTETQTPLMPEQLNAIRKLFDAFRITVLEEFAPGEETMSAVIRRESAEKLTMTLIDELP